MIEPDPQDTNSMNLKNDPSDSPLGAKNNDEAVLKPQLKDGAVGDPDYFEIGHKSDAVSPEADQRDWSVYSYVKS